MEAMSIFIRDCQPGGTELSRHPQHTQTNGTRSDDHTPPTRYGAAFFHHVNGIGQRLDQ